ncbi:MAG TPA: DUF3800 domain-containing protein [Anaerolineae bacterium]|nr:DUF3800 domain-containing protein [Anaerolineae bacterium]HQI86375.1 DUF3800 domain-containing protein [Anaerolineae bacterium]
MLLFVDESGVDRREAPYEVLAGVAIRERNLWPLIQAIRAAERDHFGMLLRETLVEFKGKKLLKDKVFRFARQGVLLPKDERTALAGSFLRKGLSCEIPQRREFTAYGQAVLTFVQEIYALCGQFGVKVFASMVDPHSPRPEGNFLRKDYAYLFERFYYYLEDISVDEMGVIVFDELEKARCQRLLTQMETYFLQTYNGRMRSSRIIPEPFFVHSDLTTLVQLADIVAYSLNWGLRLNRMYAPTRVDLEPFGQQAFDLRYVGHRFDEREIARAVYGVTYIDDLRPREEREGL